MAVSFNGTTLTGLYLNGSAATTASFNGTTVFAGSTEEVIVSTKTVRSGVSVAPPPYNSEGYNVDTLPPEATKMEQISFDASTFHKITFEWDNKGSVNSYGEISAYVVLRGTRYNLYSDLDKSGKIEINTSSLSGTQTLDIFAVAKSLSAYSGYISESVVNLKNVIGHTQGVTPTPEVISFTLDSGTSSAPPPYDENGYNYNDAAPELKVEKHITVDVTDKNTLTMNWQRGAACNDDYGIISCSWGINESYTNLFRKTNQDYDYDADNSQTRDVSSMTGNITLDFYVEAQSLSPYRGWNSRSVLQVDSITLT